MQRFNTTIILSVLLFVLWVSATPVFATEPYQPLVTLPGVTNAGTGVALGDYLAGAFRLFIGVSIVLAVIMIIIGGLQYMSSDAISNKDDGRKRISSALYGLLLVLSTILIMQTINPNILNFNLDLALPDLSNPTAGKPEVTCKDQAYPIQRGAYSKKTAPCTKSDGTSTTLVSYTKLSDDPAFCDTYAGNPEDYCIKLGGSAENSVFLFEFYRKNTDGLYVDSNQRPVGTPYKFTQTFSTHQMCIRGRNAATELSGSRIEVVTNCVEVTS